MWKAYGTTFRATHVVAVQANGRDVPACVCRGGMGQGGTGVFCRGCSSTLASSRPDSRCAPEGTVVTCTSPYECDPWDRGHTCINFWFGPCFAGANGVTTCQCGKGSTSCCSWANPSGIWQADCSHTHSSTAWVQVQSQYSSEHHWPVAAGCADVYSGSQKYVPTFEPTLHQDFQLWLC